MPSRVIREGMLTSEPVNDLSWQAECFFYRLMLKADDFGCFDAREVILRASLYPLRINQVREADITRWMAECQKAGLIVLYEADGKRFLEIAKFDQRLRAKNRKWPVRDGQVPVTCQTPAHGIGGENRRRESESEVGANKSRPPANDLAWLTELRDDPAYKGIDVAREHAKAARWCITNHRQLTRKFFVNWLNKCDKPIHAQPSNGKYVSKAKPLPADTRTDEEFTQARDVVRQEFEQFKQRVQGSGVPTVAAPVEHGSKTKL